ncbi:hypothetical protein [Methanofollis tationis]|uniref:Uncharacterized protein n=1 Tax=Methanofollis tationis TaxID=81417 RepID=A0A7K4HMI7_9EURY|nr:hypothetical protein [Methanofollis tationis]
MESDKMMENIDPRIARGEGKIFNAPAGIFPDLIVQGDSGSTCRTPEMGFSLFFKISERNFIAERAYVNAIRRRESRIGLIQSGEHSFIEFLSFKGIISPRCSPLLLYIRDISVSKSHAERFLGHVPLNDNIIFKYSLRFKDR